MEKTQRDLILRHRPYIYQDRHEPFPVKFIGCTVFREKTRSESFPKWVIDPNALGAELVIEYAVYYDYDIQHLYDLEHIWVAVGKGNALSDCWCSCHGMRLRAAGMSTFVSIDSHPVLYAQPGKHAMLPSPDLFALFPDLHAACTDKAGGGLLIPSMLEGKIRTDDRRDVKICEYIRQHHAFCPSMEFVMEPISPEQFISWKQLLERIPGFISEQLTRIEA